MCRTCAREIYNMYIHVCVVMIMVMCVKHILTSMASILAVSAARETAAVSLGNSARVNVTTSPRETSRGV